MINILKCLYYYMNEVTNDFEFELIWNFVYVKETFDPTVNFKKILFNWKV